MKKTLFLCLLLFSLVFFSACSGNSVSDSKAENTGTGTEVSSEKEVNNDEAENNSDKEKNSKTENAAEAVNAQSQTAGLSITSPSKEANYTTGYNWNVIRGLTTTNTAAIEVNGYRLKKYIPGSQHWNYIAAVQMQTLATGNNDYVVKAFDADDNVINEITYHINYQNGHALPNVGTSLNIILFLTLIFSLNFFIRRHRI